MAPRRVPDTAQRLAQVALSPHILAEDAFPIFQTVTLARQVYDHLRQGILTNKYPPGAQMPEGALAAKLNVSRGPVREALRELAAEGLVTVVARHRAVVSSLSKRDFLNAYQVRESLELLALRLALPRLSAADMAELANLQDGMEQHVLRDEADAFFVANAAFHKLFVDRSGNEKLQELYTPLVNQMRRYYMPSLYLRGGMKRSLEEHTTILLAILQGDADAAVRLLSEHIRVPQRILEQDGELALVQYQHAG